LTKFEVLLSRTAQRQLGAFPADVAERIKRKMRVLEEAPTRPRPGADIRMLWGYDEPAMYRLRIGDYRVLYFVMADEVRVTEVLHRSKAYRGLD
jgi:mRNA-degrading endonuclease RelE of RelBE toxin-antitoxin system